MTLKWIYLQIKQYVFRISSWGMIVLAILVIGFIREVGQAESKDCLVLLSSEESKVGTEVVDALLQTQIDGFVFRKVDAKEEITWEVTRSEASCGAVFTEDLDEHAKNGSLNRGDVEFIQSSESIDGYVVKEIIYPYILKAASNDLLEDYLDKAQNDLPETEALAILDANEEYLEQTKINIYQTKELASTDQAKALSGDGRLREQAHRDYALGVWLIFAMILFITEESEKENQQFYSVCGQRKKRFFEFTAVLSNAVLTVLLIGGICFMEKIPILLALGVCCTIWSLLFRWILGRRYIYVLPVWMIISLIICPVLYDLSGIIPQIVWIGYIFPIVYFL